MKFENIYQYLAYFLVENVSTEDSTKNGILLKP